MTAIVESPVAHQFDAGDVSAKASPCGESTQTNSPPTLPPLGRTDSLPSQIELARCADLPVVDSKGVARPFSSLYEDENRRTLIIFVRHFFCGMCQDFLRYLSASITPKDLDTLPRPTSIIIIGCGRPELIRHYAANTNCEFPIYADPGRKVYDAFGMPSTLALGPTSPEYQTSKMFNMMCRSIFQGLSSGTGALKGGSFTQVGGEYLFERGTVTWCHKMRNTRDHTEVADLRRVIGLD